MPRILTYNVHRCVGTDRKLDVGRIADVIAALEPDIVALQELDVGRSRTGGVDQAHEIARRLGMGFRFHPALVVEDELYGDAILTALPERLIRAAALPGYPRITRLEPRGALWIAVDIRGKTVNIINTHLGLVPAEQRLQATALSGHTWLADPRCTGPTVLLGDFNATEGSGVYRTLTAKLTPARKLVATNINTATFPSGLPLLAIDHVFVSREIAVQQVTVPRSTQLRVASDHLPLVVDFNLKTSDAG